MHHLTLDYARKGNDALKGKDVAVTRPVNPLTCQNGTSVQWLTTFSAEEHMTGGYVTLDLIGLSGSGSIGVAMEVSIESDLQRLN